MNSEPDHFKVARKLVLVPETPKFQLYTDSEIRTLEGANEMSEAMKNGQCQCTISNMISTTQNLKSPRYPTFQEVENLAVHLVKIYPSLLQDRSHVCSFFLIKII